MNPKEIMQKYFISFERGDWEDFRNLHSHNVIVHLNGIHKLSGRYSGFIDFRDNLVSKIPKIFPKNFSVTPLKMISENNEIFIHAIVLADRLEAYFAYRATIENGKITKLWIYSDSQKLANSFQT